MPLTASAETSARQPHIDRCPACAVVGGEENAAAISPSKEIRAGDGKSLDVVFGNPIDFSPACAIVGGKKDAAPSPGKEIRAGDGKRTDVSVRQTRIDSVQLVPLLVERKTPRQSRQRDSCPRRQATG